MEPTSEIRRLLDIMPASGRMMTKIISKPQQSQVIDSPFPLPWMRDRPIYINFDLWNQLRKPQRDLLLLRTVCWVIGVKWFQPNLYQGIVLVGVIGTLVELVQVDVVGAVTAGGLTALATSSIWRKNRNPESQLAADDEAIRVALRRGYSETEAATHLLATIEAVAKIEGRPSLDFTELLRCQNLRALAGNSPMSVPENFKN